MRIGSMHTSNLVHIARHVKTTHDGHKLYAPLCGGMRRGNVAYLGTRAGTRDDVTCQRCQKKTQ
jgi:hypothetical protein